MRRRLHFISFGFLLLVFLGGCGQSYQGASTTSSSHTIALSNCPDSLPSPLVTTPIPASTTHTIYVGSGGNLYAFNAQNGAALWCKQVRITGAFPCPGSCPAPPFMFFGEPAVADGVVYVCAAGFGGYTYAFRAKDGSLLWRAKSDCAVDSMPFADYAVPLIDHGVVYSGSYALRAQDGTVLWSTHAGGGYISLQVLVDGVLYANDEESIYALNASDGSVRWQYTAPDKSPPGGRLLVADNRVYFGTLDPGNALYALDATNGSLLWKSSMAVYGNVTLSNGLVYISSTNQTIYALRASGGAIRWQYKSATPADIAGVGAGAILYLTMDGLDALDASSDRMIWRQPLSTGQSEAFTPVALASNIIYLGCTDVAGNSIIYALSAATGAIYWHSSKIPLVTPLTVI